MLVRDPRLLPWLAGFALLLAGLGLFAEQVNPWLDYREQAILSGQWWRLLTCHLVHINLWHTGMNLSGFLLCCYFFSDIYSRGVFLTWLASALPVSFAFLFFDNISGSYVGLSGVLHGWLVLALVAGIRGNPWLHSLVLALVAGRLTWEQLPGYDVDYLRAYIDARVYVNAHLYGSLAGALIGVVLLWRRIGGTGERPDDRA